MYVPGFKSLRHGDATWHHVTWITLVQVMACYLFGANSLP